LQKDKCHGHRCVIASRCEEILPMPTDLDKKKKKDTSTVKLKEGVQNQIILVKVLEYIYTDTVNFPKLDAPAILYLRQAADHFKIDRLGWLCEDYLVNTMNMDNVFPILKASHEMHEARIKDFCMKFALEHYNEFVANKNGLHILGIDLFQEVVAGQADQKRFQAIKLREEPKSTLISDYKRMYEVMPYNDIKFSIDGEEIVCHKSILGACSPKFVPLFKDPPPNGIELKNVSPQAFRSLLKFLYYGDDDIDPLPACELVAFARQYELDDLVRICENKIRTSIAVDTVLGILEVAYMPDIVHKQDLVEELKNKTFPFILENLKKIDLGPLKGMNPMIAQDILLRLQQHQKQFGSSSSAKKRRR